MGCHPSKTGNCGEGLNGLVNGAFATCSKDEETQSSSHGHISYIMEKQAGTNSPWYITTGGGWNQQTTGYSVIYKSNAFGTNKDFVVLKEGKPLLRATMTPIVDFDEWEIYRYKVPAFEGQECLQKEGGLELFKWVHISLHGGKSRNVSIVEQYVSADKCGPVHLRIKGKWPSYESREGKNKVVGWWEADEDVIKDKRRIHLSLASSGDLALHLALAVATKRSKPKNYHPTADQTSCWQIMFDRLF